MPIETPQGNLDIKNATLRTSNLETQNIKIGSIFVGTGNSLEETANVGNSMSNTIQFTNTHTAFTTTANVEVGGGFTVTGNVAVGTNKLFVDTVNSRVGIGTTSPFTPLQIFSTNEITSSPAGSSVSQMRYGSTNSTVLFGVSSTAGHISAYDTSNFSTRRNLCFNADGGNVGIGTTNPQYRLDVGNGGGDVMLRVMNQTASSGKLIFGRSGDTEIRSHAIESYNSSGSQNNYMKFLVHDGTGTSPYETRTEVMTLLGNGNVGIGITSPSAPLDVRGVENPDMMAMFKTVSAAMRFHTGQGGTSNNWKNTEISLSGGSGGGAILFCFTMNNSSGDRSGAILYFIRKSHTADGTTNGDWNNDSSSVFKISGLSGGGSATSLDFQRNGNKLEYRTSSVGNGYFYAIEFD